jgi:hypothetical protein
MMWRPQVPIDAAEEVDCVVDSAAPNLGHAVSLVFSAAVQFDTCLPAAEQAEEEAEDGDGGVEGGSVDEHVLMQALAPVASGVFQRCMAYNRNTAGDTLEGRNDLTAGGVAWFSGAGSCLTPNPSRSLCERVDMMIVRGGFIDMCAASVRRPEHRALRLQVDSRCGPCTRAWCSRTPTMCPTSASCAAIRLRALIGCSSTTCTWLRLSRASTAPTWRYRTHFTHRRPRAGCMTGDGHPRDQYSGRLHRSRDHN